MVTHTLNSIYTTIDLELNKENGYTTDIIQIGYAVGNVFTGEILESGNVYVKIAKPLSEFIITLTGITENDLATKGTSLLEAFNQLKKVHQQYNSHPCLVQWGGGDSITLYDQLIAKGMDPKEWIFGRREWDVKTIAQSILLAKQLKFQGGLKKMSLRFGVPVQGPMHDAKNDAIATFNLFCYFLKELKGIYVKQ